MPLASTALVATLLKVPHPTSGLHRTQPRVVECGLFPRVCSTTGDQHLASEGDCNRRIGLDSRRDFASGEIS
eukprot:2107926-Prymnesium_polylepis.1